MAPLFSDSLKDYPVSFVVNQRVIGPIDEGELPPPGSEVFVSRIPSYVNEFQLFPFFQQVGNIFKIRLMVDGNMSTNRGFCYVTYTSPSEAEHAVNILQEITFMGRYLTIEMSYDNCRLFVGGIPEYKSKDEVWKELTDCGFGSIVEIIMYRSYTDRAKNRGYVFVEFETHQKAAEARHLFSHFKLWGSHLTVDWSTPLPKVDENTYNKITILFFRNLKVTESREVFIKMLAEVLGPIPLMKVFRFKDYAFVHFLTRSQAELAKIKLTDHFKNTVVEVKWAIPPYLAPKKRHVQPVTPQQNHTQLFNKEQLSSFQLIQTRSLQCSRMLFPNTSPVCTNLESYEQFNNVLTTTTPAMESVPALILKDCRQAITPQQNRTQLINGEELPMSSSQLFQTSSLQCSRPIFPRISSPCTNLESYEQFNNFLATSTPAKESVPASISKDSAISLSNEEFFGGSENTSAIKDEYLPKGWKNFFI